MGIGAPRGEQRDQEDWSDDNRMGTFMESEKEQMPLAGKAARVLLIDDEPAIVSAIRRTLGSRGLAITALTDPREALEAALAEEFALIISDNMMPGLHGLDLLRQVQVHHPNTRRILLTGHTELDAAVAAFNDDTIHRFFKKPWNKEELLSAVDQELQEYQAEQQDGEERSQLQSDINLRNKALRVLITELKEAKKQLAGAANHGQAKLPVLPANVRNLSVVAVDQDENLRRRVTGLLHRAGISNCTAFESGREVLEHLRYAPPVDVVLAEWALKEMDGVALFNKLRAGSSLSANATFILLATAQTQRSVQYALHAGVDGYITKPFQLDAMLTQVRRAALKAQNNIGVLLKELRPLNYLVANSDHTYAAQIEHMLVTNGAKDVTLVRSGRAALNHCLARPTDLVIYDCNVQDPDWSRFGAAISGKLNSGTPPSMVVTSDEPRREVFEQASKAGLTTYYPGPPKPQHFFFTLLKARESRAPQTEIPSKKP